ncbi:MAG TPA: hypothetical protein VFQ79_00845 [Bryobacteraceae bacterium]|nr:hypothetical protein [Bryobacteraceae bacterium]
MNNDSNRRIKGVVAVFEHRVSEPFFTRRRIKPNGHLEEIIVGAPFATVVIALSMMAMVIVLTLLDVDMNVLLPVIAKLGS